ncbi:MAG: Na(+)/H(+) antiporter subunit D [Rhodospirillales bacterium]|jgi:multicomponent Na+:H+ antiporter subunit D|nr:Na(+)/H(+) antiporter subunit D [Rhodospirillales bacterium]
MTTAINPGVWLIFGGLLAAILPSRLRAAYCVALPIAVTGIVLGLEGGLAGRLSFLGVELITLRVDGLARLFAILFCLAAVLAALFAWTVQSRIEAAASLVYAGSALGAALAGDLLTLFVFWEMAAIGSVLLIWARGTPPSYHAGVRYLIVQVGSGVLLLAGAVLRFQETGSAAFDVIGLGDTAGALIFIAFGIKAAFPLLHNWLVDAYPESTPTGTVWLSAFTTKLAIYALARGFPGTEILIWIGVAMACFPIFYAVIENDLRRVLGYSTINQLGFMVAGIGVGTTLSLNGAVAHAFCDMIFKAVLFMAMGAVLLRTGTIKGSELGGLYKTMPKTAGLCIIGAASISAFPLFSGFVSKGMIMAAIVHEGLFVPWLLLLFASAGVFHHAGIKIPFFAFFAHDSGRRVEEAPWHMLAAMAIGAALCVGIGVHPAPLYALLPDAVDYVAYTTEHVVTQTQLLLFSALAFTWLYRTHRYPPELPSVNLDFDWTYRRLLPTAVAGIAGAISRLHGALRQGMRGLLAQLLHLVHRHHGPEGVMARTVSAGSMAFWVVVALAGYLIAYEVSR